MLFFCFKICNVRAGAFRSFGAPKEHVRRSKYITKKSRALVLLGLSGKRGSNPRPSAWEANALPLSYCRIASAKIQYKFIIPNAVLTKIVNEITDARK